MRVIHFSALGANTGAGRAALNIHKSLLLSGCDSRMVIENAAKDDPLIISPHSSSIARKIRGLRIARKRHEFYSKSKPKALFIPDEFSTMRADDLRLPASPEIIHLHWISGFLNSAQIASLWNKYRVTLHDLRAGQAEVEEQMSRFLRVLRYE